MTSLLEERRKKYEIPEALYQPVFDRVLIYQVPTVESETFASTLNPGEASTLIRPETTKRREQRQSPRGVIVAMGLKAKEILQDHGVDLGHIVWFARMAMWKHEVDSSLKEFAIIHAGEICGSEDLLTEMTVGGLTWRYDTKITKDKGQWVLSTHLGGERSDPQEWSDQ
jgi:hypothetical protein